VTGPRTHVRRALVSLGAALCVTSASAPARAVKVQVRGSATVKVVATQEDETFTIRGEVVDDIGASLSGAEVEIELVDQASGRSRPLPLFRSCLIDTLDDIEIQANSPVRVDVTTDDRGAFCLRADGQADGAKAVVRYDGTEHYGRTEASAEIEPVEARLTRTLVRFEPPQERIDLDRDTVGITASLSIDRSEASRLRLQTTARREGAELSIVDERGEVVAIASTGGDGRARFEIQTDDLAPPGLGHLAVEFAGSDTLAKASASHPVIRLAEARLRVDQIEGDDPEDGIPILVDVVSGRGAVHGGVVEALRGGASIGAGDVEDGRARVVVTFPGGRAADVPVTLRYVPASPWWRPGPELAVDVPVAGPSLWRQILLGAVLGAIAAWILAKWRRAPKPVVPVDVTQAPPLSGRPGIEVVATSAGQSGWNGMVHDAHEGTPISGALIKIVLPSFDGEDVLAEARSTDGGSFELEGSPPSQGAQLVVEADMHARYEIALPPPSILRVALVTRRRALVDRLVRWARRRGSPFDGPPEPTPGHVRRVAARQRTAEIEEWARKVEHTVFGPDAVDARVEDAVRASEPSDRPALMRPASPEDVPRDELR
jgi:hypothetical protein